MGIIRLSDRIKDVPNDGELRWGDDLHLTMEMSKSMLNVWKDMCSGSMLPREAEFDLLEHPEFAPQLLFIDYLQPRNCYRIRYNGSGLVEAMGRDLTGTEIHPSKEDLYRQAHFDIYDICRRQAEPVVSCGYIIVMREEEIKDYIFNEAVHLPMLDAAGQVNHIVGVQSFRLQTPDHQ